MVSMAVSIAVLEIVRGGPSLIEVVFVCTGRTLFFRQWFTTASAASESLKIIPAIIPRALTCFTYFRLSKLLTDCSK